MVNAHVMQISKCREESYPNFDRSWHVDCLACYDLRQLSTFDIAVNNDRRVLLKASVKRREKKLALYVLKGSHLMLKSDDSTPAKGSDGMEDYAISSRVVDPNRYETIG
jgi:hypothetical protein